MKLKMYQADAFADQVFSGNPAAVCLLDSFLDDEVMQCIAAENNLAETAFAVRTGEGTYDLRWFTPRVEVDLCGHATLATAHVLYQHYGEKHSKLNFQTKSGGLTVEKSKDLLVMDFPKDKIKAVGLNTSLNIALGKVPSQTLKGVFDYLVIFPAQSDIEELEPDFSLLKNIETRGIIVSAEGDEVDFVSRFFAPRVGINEDPVTGSAHTTLIPFWAEELGKNELVAQQLSHRKGTLYCKNLQERVEIAGKAVTYLEGTIWI